MDCILNQDRSFLVLFVLGLDALGFYSGEFLSIFPTAGLKKANPGSESVLVCHCFWDQFGFHASVSILSHAFFDVSCKINVGCVKHELRMSAL